MSDLPAFDGFGISKTTVIEQIHNNVVAALLLGVLARLPQVAWTRGNVHSQGQLIRNARSLPHHNALIIIGSVGTGWLIIRIRVELLVPCVICIFHIENYW